MVGRYGPHNPDETYVAQKFPEQLFDTGELQLNYATAGDASQPALLLVPGQTESWWGYEAAMELLKDRFQIFAVDLRGQGRSGRTPGRYTLDNMGNDLLRLIQGVIGRPTLVSGLSSGGVLSAWLSAYAPPGVIRAAHYVRTRRYSAPRPRPPTAIRSSNPSGRCSRCGRSTSATSGASATGPAWPPTQPASCRHGWPASARPQRRRRTSRNSDPEWGRAFLDGNRGGELRPRADAEGGEGPGALFTHHFRRVDETTGFVMGAISDLQAGRVRAIIEEAGQPLDYRSFPQMGHSMHGQDPKLFADTLSEWAATIGGG